MMIDLCLCYEKKNNWILSQKIVDEMDNMADYSFNCSILKLCCRKKKRLSFDIILD